MNQTQRTNAWLELFAELVEVVRERRGRELTERELRLVFAYAVDEL